MTTFAEDYPQDDSVPDDGRVVNFAALEETAFEPGSVPMDLICSRCGEPIDNFPDLPADRLCLKCYSGYQTRTYHPSPDTANTILYMSMIACAERALMICDRGEACRLDSFDIGYCLRVLKQDDNGREGEAVEALRGLLHLLHVGVRESELVALHTGMVSGLSMAAVSISSKVEAFAQKTGAKWK